MHLDPVPESARRARRLVTDVLGDAGRLDLLDSASLLVSELVTNAILHARTRIDVVVTATPRAVHVAVTDHSPLQPARRDYDASATTGRGLEMVDLIAARSGSEIQPDGKTMWFELGASDAPHHEDPVVDDRAAAAGLVLVRLLGTPMRLARAWQQHADALLREYLLACWEAEGDIEGRLATEQTARSAFAALAGGLDTADADDGRLDVTLPLPSGAGEGFVVLDRLLDDVATMAENGELLAPPPQPEIQLLRRWFCRQARDQLAGAAPTAWPGLEVDAVAARARPVDWDGSGVRHTAAAVVAADDANRIVAVSRAAAALLGWPGDALVGQRIVSIIPARFREEHIAAFTHHALTGRTTILDRAVQLPALRRDGSEVQVDLVVRRVTAGAGRAVFVATLTPIR